jgi:hypothetical protein
MVWQPGKSGNPSGYNGPRDRARRAVFERIQALKHTDALETLSTLQNDPNTEPALRVAAASALANYCHPKMQSLPVPRYVELQIDVPEFTHVSDAENFLAKIALLVARGHLDIQSAQELSGLVKLWIDSQYQKDELQFKLNPPEQRDTSIHVVGGLPALPGTQIDMPQFNGHVADARALAAPIDAVPHAACQHAAEGTNQAQETALKEFSPGEAKAKGPYPLKESHFRTDEDGLARQGSPAEPGKNSPTNGGQEP